MSARPNTFDMKINVVRAPMVIGSLIAGALVVIALVDMLMSDSRWDDHLLNAIGVLGGALFLSLTLKLTTAAFRPPPDLPRRAKVIRIVWLIAFVLVMCIVISVAIFINSMSFL
jgi:hypothetical protein